MLINQASPANLWSKLRPFLVRKLFFPAALFAASLSSLGQGSIAVYPENSTIEVGSTRQFSAYVPISPNTVTWKVNDTLGGDGTHGSVSGTGLYVAPAVAPASNIVKIKVTSTAFPNSVGVATVKITRKYPWLWGTSPSSIVTGNYQVNFNGSNFAPDSQALANGLPVQTTYVSPTKLVVQGSAAQPGTLTFSVQQPGNGEVIGNSVNVQVAGNPVTVAVTPTTATVQLGLSKAFAATVTGSANNSVTWSVNGVAGGSANHGLITAAGIYTAPNIMPANATIAIRAASVANPASFNVANVTLTAPPVVQTAWLAGARFLEQSSFGPTAASLADVQQVGIEPYLLQQLAMSETLIPTPSGNSIGALRQWVLHNYTTAPDQLRQRVAYSLGQIIVTSGNKLNYADEMLPWLRLLSKHAFGNYRDLLRDVTKSPSMGKYLDLANSMKPGLAGGANENYGREVLQLFSIGLWKLKQDGSYQYDSLTNTIPTYEQEDVKEISRALTGWTYATAPGAVPQNNNWEYFGAPMESRQQNHDNGSKTFLSFTIPAGQTVEQDLESILDCLMTHTNTAPFIATRLIRSLVTSNPSAGYIKRVADVFVNDGTNERGDLKEVIKAILLDPEARQDTATLNSGRLKEPILQVAGFLRALNGHFTSGQQLTYMFDYLAQGVLNPPSVFNWFSPLYRVPKKSHLFGPEFQIYTASEATLRGNLIYHLLTSPGGDAVLDLAQFQPYGNNMPGMVEVANQKLLYGRMSPEMKQIILNAATPGYDANTRIATVLYLTTLSGQYAVQH